MINSHEQGFQTLQAVVKAGYEESIGLLGRFMEEENESELLTLQEEIIDNIESVGLMASASNLSQLYENVTRLEGFVCEAPIEEKNTVLENISGWMSTLVSWQGEDESELVEALKEFVPELAGQDDLMDLGSEQDKHKLSEDIDMLMEGDLALVEEEEKLNQSDDEDGSLASILDDGIEEEDESSVEFLNFPFEDDSEGPADDIASYMASELRELNPQFIKLASLLGTGDFQEKIQACENYLSLLERVSDTSDEVGLQSLSYACSLIEKNICSYRDSDIVSLNNDMQGLLDVWPQKLVDHLLNPVDDQYCLELIDFFENKNWLAPLEYTQQRAFIECLTYTVQVTEEQEDEIEDDFENNDITLTYSEDASPQLIQAFITEAPGLAETLSLHIQNISKGVEVASNINAAQRISHTIKGSANLVGVKGLANLTHHLEYLFEYLNKQQISPPPLLAAAMIDVADTMESILNFLQGRAEEPDNTLEILKCLMDWSKLVDDNAIMEHAHRLSPREVQASSSVVTLAESIGKSVDENKLITGNKPHAPISREPKKNSLEQPITNSLECGLQNSPERSITNSPELSAENSQQEQTPQKDSQAVTQNHHLQEASELIQVPRQTLDKIFNLVSETSITMGQIQERLRLIRHDGDSMRDHDRIMQQRRFNLENAVNVKGLTVKSKLKDIHQDEFDALEFDQYDEFYTATHSFIEIVDDSREANRQVNKDLFELEKLSHDQQRLHKELQEIVLSTRMEPVHTLSGRLQRTVRQACRMTGKECALHIEGEQMLIDGDMLKRIAAPLMHILRNAVDHGIEDAQTRKRKNKSSEGKITLSFRQEGNKIRIECTDDGAGLNFEAIKQKAIQKGFLSSDDNPDHSVLVKMILRNGFSTREQATQVSGRGVGMDAVYAEVLALKGSLEIQDHTQSPLRDHGTLISMNLPMTMLTSHSLLVRSGETQVAVPTNTLSQILPPNSGRIKKLAGKPCYLFEDVAYPLKTLAELLGNSHDESEFPLSELPVLLVQIENEIEAVAVEQAVSSYDLVIKSTGEYVSNVDHIAGIALLGNGAVVPVLNLPYLLSGKKAQRDIEQHDDGDQQSEIQNQLPQVLIVDDSLSVRNSLSQLVSDNGYEPVLARDGVEALRIFEEKHPDMVLTDLEMPRMTGIELTTHLRNSHQPDIPIVMITSRTMRKHRDQAEKAGVNQYMTKPYSSDELLNIMQNQLAG